MKNDGFFLGNSLAMNCVRAIRCSVTQSIGPGHSIVTMICDSDGAFRGIDLEAVEMSRSVHAFVFLK